MQAITIRDVPDGIVNDCSALVRTDPRGDGTDPVSMLVLTCITDETGESAAEVLAAGYVDVDERDYVGIVHRLESYFDCTLDLFGSASRRLVLADIVAAIPAGSGGSLAGG